MLLSFMICALYIPIYVGIYIEREDLTGVIISYEIYETSYGMTTSIIFCLSYDCFKQSFIALKMELVSGHTIFTMT